MNNKKYFVGLDIGTNSVGWATSDENYQLLHLKHKSAWGVNLFDAAETAEKRRVYRTTRRRLQRRRQRVLLLQDLFKDEMHKIDQYFFLRLNNSAYFSEDKNELLNSSRFNLFSDKDFTDKEFFKKYKTIYHLQKDLIENKDTKFDLRYIYLAVHHLVKYRGHFVLADQRINIDEFEYEQINLIFEELNDYLLTAELPVIFSSNHIESFNEVVRKTSGVINTSSRLETLFECSDKSIKAAFRLISGGAVKTKNLFSHLILSETVEKETIDLSSPTYDTEKYPLLAKELGDDIVFLDSLKRLYDHIVIVRLMKGKKLVCETMVERYEKHSEDLKKLKLLIKSTRDKELYFSIFRDTKSKNANYPSYVGSNKSNTKKTSVNKKGYQDFLDYIKKVIIDRNLETILAKEILSDIEEKVFMPRLDTKDNATIPYQFNEYQLDLILQNAAKFYPFLNDIEEGINVIDKIKSLISFRIPYYVGPLDNRSKFSWVVRKSDEQVKPWNFGSIIDIEKSAQAFIMKMTNKCVYLKGEDVLPKESLLFEEFVVLNTLNCLKVNGKLIDYDTKQLIFNFVKQKKTVTTNMIMKLLMANNIVVEALSGIDETAKLSLSTYHKFLPIFGESIDKYKELIEKIVFYSTIFPEGIVFKNKLYSDFKNILTKEQLSTISKMKFSGWSSLSRAFLTGYSKLQEDNVLTNLKTGEIISIIDIMRDEQLTLQQVLYDKRFNLQELLYKYNLTYSENMTINDYIDEMYISPSVKRPVKKAIHIIDEIISITNSKPNKIFIEVTREEGKPERKISRQQKLINLYKPILKDNEHLKALYQEIVSRKDADFKPKKLLLYFIQQGKCMYTGQSISINELMTDKYDIDHIIPQSKIDDDSISNLCLVTNKSNKDKADVYPLNYEIIQRMKPFWQSLLKENFIDDNKYNRLIRVEPLSDQDLAIFINRQLVETSQANKAIADILKKYYPESEVIYSKARNVTLFRGKFSIYKSIFQSYSSISSTKSLITEPSARSLSGRSNSV
ncbi:MAG: type II CRISPR RNA-guided endonuclease Cas9 [Weeksellaceae bacterium]|nr:type II CRISPR RNA-guided endonuclease Cas9 [Weeksellaceae bacterium]